MGRVQALDVRNYYAAPTPTVTPHGGTGATWGYKLVAITNPIGVTGERHSAVGSEGTGSGGATLGGAVYNVVTWTDVVGVLAYDVYRTSHGTTPAHDGLLGRVLAGVQTFTDLGAVVGDDVAGPAANTTGTGDPAETLSLRDKTIQVSGTFVGTIQVEGTIDGDTWIAEGTAYTSTGSAAVTPTWAMMRARMTAYTSGTPKFNVAGHHGE